MLALLSIGIQCSHADLPEFSGAKMQNEIPQISVIIPAYNRASLLSRAVDSARTQDFQDLEILIVDDGSSDGTAEVANEIAQKDSRIRVIKHEQNRGEAAARNTGLRNSRGRYLAFLDSDDSWLPGKLTRQHELIKTADPNVIAVATSQIIVAPDGSRSVEKDSWHFKLPVTQRNLLTRGCAIGLGGNLLMRREPALAAGEFDTSLRLYVDVDWLCRFLTSGNILAKNEAYTLYNKADLRPGEMVEQSTLEFLRKNKEMLNKYSRSDRRAIKANFYRSIALSYQAHGNRWANVRHSALAIIQKPIVPIGNYIEIFDQIFGLNSLHLLRKITGRNCGPSEG
ncbi:MAG: glycosyltransferase family 2 protein [Thalassospira sp.]|uniref:glycosyltransferase family 2 protein n=1 Tax=Thalassospira sp. TaxID=1912094 RepID=UPI0032EB2DD8